MKILSSFVFAFLASIAMYLAVLLAYFHLMSVIGSFAAFAVVFGVLIVVLAVIGYV